MDISPLDNRLLALFPKDVRLRLTSKMELVPLECEKILYEPGRELHHVYFPVDAIVSMLYGLADGSSTEIAIVGNEGLVGIAAFMGGESTPSKAIVINGGFAYKISSQSIIDEFNRHGEILLLLLRYTQSLISQIAQTAICNRRHTLNQQLCRFLLSFLDRTNDTKITITHDTIAQILGVRREACYVRSGKIASTWCNRISPRTHHCLQ